MLVMNDPQPFWMGFEGIVHIVFHKLFQAYSIMVPSGCVGWGTGTGWMMKIMARQKRKYFGLATENRRRDVVSVANMGCE